MHHISIEANPAIKAPINLADIAPIVRRVTKVIWYHDGKVSLITFSISFLLGIQLNQFTLFKFSPFLLIIRNFGFLLFQVPKYSRMFQHIARFYRFGLFSFLSIKFLLLRPRATNSFEFIVRQFSFLFNLKLSDLHYCKSRTLSYCVCAVST